MSQPSFAVIVSFQGGTYVGEFRAASPRDALRAKLEEIALIEGARMTSARLRLLLEQEPVKLNGVRVWQLLDRDDFEAHVVPIANE